MSYSLEPLNTSQMLSLLDQSFESTPDTPKDNMVAGHSVSLSNNEFSIHNRSSEDKDLPFTKKNYKYKAKKRGKKLVEKSPRQSQNGFNQKIKDNGIDSNSSVSNLADSTKSDEYHLQPTSYSICAPKESRNPILVGSSESPNTVTSDKQNQQVETYKNIYENFTFISRKIGYQCNRCGRLLKKRWSLTNHTYRCENQKLFICEICKKRFNTEDGLKSHGNMHLEFKEFVCLVPNCGLTYRTKKGLGQHTRDKHKNMNDIVAGSCKICKRVFYNKKDFETHSDNHKKPKKWMCICGSGFSYAPGLSKHRSNCRIYHVSRLASS